MANGIVLNIDTTKSEFQNPMIELRQGDGNYQSIDVTVTSNGSPFNLTGWTITFMGTTAGGFKIVDTAVSTLDTANGKFTYTPTKAWGQDEGMFKEAYFKFTSGVNGNSVASGASIRVNVLTAVDLTAEEAKDYISVVDVLIDDVKTSMDTKLSETKQTLAYTQSQANTVQANVNDLNTNVNNLKTQNLNIKTTDNTWTGTNTFTNQINGSLATRFVPVFDFNTIASDTKKYSGFWFVSDTNVVNGPTADSTWGLIEVVAGNTYTTGLIRYTRFVNGVTYMTGVNSGIVGWYKVANDNTVVHNIGTETVAGNKNFTGNTTFTQLIDGYTKTKLSTTVKDLNYITDPGKYRVDTTYTNLPTGFPSASTMFVDNNGDNSLIFQRILSRDVDGNQSGDVDVFVRMQIQSNWTPWRKLAQDQQVLHNSGTETASGNKTFTGQTTMLTGNYGLRVTTTGVQKTADGGTTWVNI